MNSLVRSRYQSERLGRNLSPHNHLIAVREESFKLATPNGLLNAHVVKIMRIDHAVSRRDQSVRRPIALPTNTTCLRAQLKEAIPASAANATPGSELTPFRLRSVGEVLTDQNGVLYEVRGEELHPLRKVVRDPHGRMFEVCQGTNNRVTRNQEIERVALRPAEPADQKTGKNSRGQTPLQSLKKLLTGLLSKLFRRTRDAT